MVNVRSLSIFRECAGGWRSLCAKDSAEHDLGGLLVDLMKWEKVHGISHKICDHLAECMSMWLFVFAGLSHVRRHQSDPTLRVQIGDRQLMVMKLRRLVDEMKLQVAHWLRALE